MLTAGRAKFGSETMMLLHITLKGTGGTPVRLFCPSSTLRSLELAVPLKSGPCRPLLLSVTFCSAVALTIWGGM